MKSKTCCFTGHRKIPEEKYDEIFNCTLNYVRTAIDVGYRYFGVGGALGFDTLAALVVLKLRECYSDIRLILVLPCVDQTKGWSETDVVLYEDIKRKADKVVYISKEYISGCMHKRNRHLVDNSSLCICYLTENKGGTYYTVNYAVRSGLKIKNVAIS